MIAAAHGGPLEMVVHGQTGLFFEPGNSESLADAGCFPDLRSRQADCDGKRWPAASSKDLYSGSADLFHPKFIAGSDKLPGLDVRARRDSHLQMGVKAWHSRIR